MNYIDELVKRKEKLGSIKENIDASVLQIEKAYKESKKILICGNGGSSSDSAHIMGELSKSFKKKRNVDPSFISKLKKYSDENECDIFNKNLEMGLKVIDLTSFTSLNTAFSNDKSYDFSFANSVLNLGDENDVLIAISTSGNSKSIVNAAKVAKAKNMKVIVLTGMDGGVLKNIGDINIISPEKETYLIQEDHESIYHSICLQVEEDLF